MWNIRRQALIILAFAALVSGCTESKVLVDQAKVITNPGPGKPAPYKIGKPYQVGGVWYYPKADYEYDETGIASWYGPGFDGKRTASGEVFDTNGLTAAHKTLPMPSMVRVTNLENGKAIVVRVNDRGPFHGDRILDLSRGAANQLGILGPGTAKVRVELVKVTPPANAAEIIARHEARTIQLMATNSALKAQDAARELTQRFGKPIRVVNANQIYRLHLGPLERKEAESMLQRLRGAGYQQAFFVN